MTSIDEVAHAIEPPNGPRKVLIADDDPAILRLLADHCVKMGFKVEIATNGMQLLVKARQNHPDILIVDVNMPEIDGLTVCTRLLDLGRKPLEVIVVTGDSDPETPERCESLGMFFGRKGPDFWKHIEAALTEIYPDMAFTLDHGPSSVDSAGVRQRPRVLVVDDDPDIEKFFGSRLDKLGIETLYAPDATTGFRMARREKPSVIICDNFMPDGDAQYLLYRLRGVAETEKIPVFVISGRQISEVTEHNLKRSISGSAGALQVFRKSFDTSELFGALQRFCSFSKIGAHH